jgi:diguanylate cyclase (GGDEF)-like protein/PAS domain S-box-containing protein
VAAVAVADRGDVAGYAILIWSIVATVLMYRASRRHTGRTRKLMNGIVACATLMCIGFVVRGVHGELVGVESPIPSPADLLHIPSYLLFLWSAVYVHRARSPRRNPDAWLDAGAVVTALVMMLWVTFFADYVLSDVVALDTRVVNGVYNLIILVTFTVFVRITATPGSRSPVYYLLGTAGFAFFVVDLAASYSLVRGEGLWLTIALSPIVFGMLVIALRHPAADQLLDRDLEAEVSIGPLRLSIISAAIGAPMLVLVFGHDQSSVSLGFLVVASVILSVLVVLRVVLLLRNQRDTALLDRRLAAELAALAGFESKAAIIDRLPHSVSAMVGGEAVVRYADRDRGENLFELPAALVRGTNVGVQVDGVGESLPPAVRRVVESLLRDAGLLVDSLEGLEALARQKSEAEANRRIAASERRFRALVERSTDMIVVLTADGTISYVSETVRNILGYEPDAVVGRPLTRLVHRNDAPTFADGVVDSLDHPGDHRWHEIRFVAADGSTRLLRFVLTNLLQVAEVDGLVVNASDVTEKRRLERDLLDAKVTDRLTLLPNRAGFIEELELTIRRTDVTGSALAVVSFNIRDFKAVNDALAPTVADQVLIRCASLIRKTARVDDLVARLGGDEFVVLMHSPRSAADAVASAERILEALSQPFEVDAHQIAIKADAGVVYRADGDADLEALQLLRDSDIALSAAKQSDSASVVLFEPAMAMEVTERLELRSGIARGLDNGEFRLVYQPVVDIETGNIRSLEALARWEHPRLGPIPPITFIDIAEQSGQIDLVGEWALRTACHQLRSWNDEGLAGFGIGVNMSVHQLRQSDIVSRVLEIVDGAGIDPGMVTIEITESVLIDNSDLIAERMRALRAAGFSLAIDDFGTGYSSLGYLQRYEFDILKIDKVFVDPLADPGREREREVVRSITSLARGLGARTVAEGIEHAVQLAVLAELGCDLAQGYHLFRPIEAADCPAVLRSTSGLARA